MQIIHTIKAIIDQKLRFKKDSKLILNSDLSSTVSFAFPDMNSITQVEFFYTLLLYALMSERRSSAAQICLIVFYFLFQLSIYHVDQRASIIIYGKFSHWSTAS